MKRAREADTITEKSKKARFEPLMETHPLRPYLSVKEEANKIELIIDEENFEKALCALEDKNFPIDGIQLEECRKPEQLQSLIKAIKSNHSITSLKVYHPTELLLTSEVTEELVKALKENASLTSPDSENIKVGVLGAGKFAEALMGSATLTPINVESAQLSSMEIGKLLQALKYNSPLTTHDGLHAIHLAALENKGQILQYLVEKEGIDLSTPYINGSTALHFAAQNGNMEALQYLIGKGGDIKAKNQQKRTPLHFAVSQGHLEVIKCLIANKADIGAKTQHEITPLYWAASQGHLEIVKCLIENKADIEAKDQQGNTPLHTAVSGGHLKVIECLIENKADIGAKAQHEITPLHTAVSGGHLKVIECLIENKADIEAKTQQGKTPLHGAASQGRLEIVKCLIEKAADIEAKDQEGNTPLHWAAFRGHLEVVKCLIEKGADIEAKDRQGKTPLYWAAFQGHLEIVKWLVEKGADIEAKDQQGRTPLHWAASKENLEIIKWLIEKGAECDAFLPFQAKEPISDHISFGHLLQSLFSQETSKVVLEQQIKAMLKHGYNLDSLLEFAVTSIENYTLKVGISEVCIPKIKACTILPDNYRISLHTFAEKLIKEVKENLESLDCLLLNLNNKTSTIMPYSTMESLGDLCENELNGAKDFYTKFPQYKTPGTYIFELANTRVTDKMSQLSGFMRVDHNILESVELILKLPIPVEARKVLTRALEDYRGCDLPQEVVFSMLGVERMSIESEGVNLPAQDYTQDTDYPMGADSNLYQD